MELLAETGILKSEELDSLMKKADELVATTLTSINTAKGNAEK
ncbi:MAG: hypothetical protein ABUK14_03505 [Desulfobacteria bacterium]|jgi:hypothetical protein